MAVRKPVTGKQDSPKDVRRGRPATLTKEARQTQLRDGKAAHRARATEAGRVRLDVTVSAETKAKIEAFRVERDLPNLGAALDAMLNE